MLLHKSGQWIKGRMSLIEIEMKGTNAAQNKGSVLSYFRRYSIQAILGMAAEDSDGVTKDKGSQTPSNSIRSQSPVSGNVQKTQEEPAVQNTGTVSTSAVKEASGDLAANGRKSFRKTAPASGAANDDL